MGIDIDDYDYRVFSITNEISRQCFPFVLDIDNPKFRERLTKLNDISVAMGKAHKRGGLLGRLAKARLGAAAAHNFIRLCALPVIDNEIPATSRLMPAW